MSESERNEARFPCHIYEIADAVEAYASFRGDLKSILTELPDGRRTSVSATALNGHTRIKNRQDCKRDPACFRHPEKNPLSRRWDHFRYANCGDSFGRTAARSDSFHRE